MKTSYTRLPDEFIEDILCKTQLTPNGWRVLMYIIRQSWGWNKESVNLRNKDISRTTGLLASNVSRTLKQYEDHKILDVINPDNKNYKTYRIKYKNPLLENVISPDNEMLSAPITSVIDHDNKSVIDPDNKDSRNPNNDGASRDPKESSKEIIKKIKERNEKLAREFKENSLADSLDKNKKPMSDEDKEKQIAKLQKQAQDLTN